MNQILITENNNPKKTNNKDKKVKDVKTKILRSPSDVSGITKVFAILILIFGIALSGDGVYAIMQNMEVTKNAKLPVVEVAKSGNTVKLSISCESGIKTVSYNWNDSTSKIIYGRGNTLVEETITIPAEGNKLNISVIDSNGQTRRYIKNLKQDEQDVTGPSIEVDKGNANVKITVTDDTEIDYITYKYGDEQEVTINATQEGQTTIEDTVQVIQGEKVLKIEAVDKKQNVTTKECTIIGTKKPTIEVIPDPNDPSYLIIKAYDDDGLRMVSYFINDQEYKTDPNTSLNSNTFEWRQKVEPGESRVLIHAYNINEQVAEFDGIYNY